MGAKPVLLNAETYCANVIPCDKLVQEINLLKHVTLKPRWVRSKLVGTLNILWMLSKKNDTSWVVGWVLTGKAWV